MGTAERLAMQSELENMRSVLNTLNAAQQQPSAAGSRHGTAAAPPQGIEALLMDISSRLASIEGMYNDMSSRLVRVDGRVGSNEQTVRELQSLSAGAMHETARLAEYVGGGGAASVAAGTDRSTAGSLTPSRAAVTYARPPGLSPAAAAAARAAVHGMPRGAEWAGPAAAAPPHLAAAVHQHASQIHKLVAGLDFLEQQVRGRIWVGVLSRTSKMSCLCILAIHSSGLRCRVRSSPLRSSSRVRCSRRSRSRWRLRPRRARDLAR